MRKVIVVLVILIVLVLAYFGYSRYLAQPSTPTPEAQSEEGEEEEAVIWASGTVLPERWATLSFEIGGLLAHLAVQEGDPVEEGTLLARLDSEEDLDFMVAQAEAALRTAQARLVQLQAGARPEEIAAAEEEVRTAQAAVTAAQAELATAEADLKAAQARLKAAQAELARVQAGSREEEIREAKANMMKAEDAMALAQTEYDKVSWQSGVGVTPQALALQRATLDYEIAKARYEALLNGATAEEVAIAQAGVEEALAGVEVARTQVEAAYSQVEGQKALVAQAKAQLDLLKAGASAEEIAIAQAQVNEAQTVLDQARADLKDASLSAPFSGTVGVVHFREGEQVMVGQPVIVFGDLTHLRIETTDLRETDVAKVKIGQEVQITLDALPGQVMSGRVSRISPMATVEKGSTNYTAIIEIDDPDPRLRWGMTAYVDITIEDGG